MQRRVRAHAGCERLARRFRRDVLVLDVDEPLGARQRRDGRALDLAYVAVALLERRDGADDAYVQVLEVGFDVLRPRGAVLDGPALDGFTSRVLPAFARALAERGRRLAL